MLENAFIHIHTHKHSPNEAFSTAINCRVQSLNVLQKKKSAPMAAIGPRELTDLESRGKGCIFIVGGGIFCIIKGFYLILNVCTLFCIWFPCEFQKILNFRDSLIPIVSDDVIKIDNSIPLNETSKFWLHLQIYFLFLFIVSYSILGWLFLAYVAHRKQHLKFFVSLDSCTFICI